MKTNNTTEKTTGDAKKLREALKEATAKSFKDILKEAIDDIADEAEEDEDEYEEVNDDAEKEGGETDTETTEDEKSDSEEKDGEDADADADADAEGADDEWSDMEDYKVGDNAYDFSDADGEMAIKVYNQLGDDDQIIIKKEDDGTYTVNDEETGAEYTIEINDDDSIGGFEDDAEGEGDDFEFEVETGDDEGDTADDEIEISVGDDDEADDDDTVELSLDDDDDELNEEKQEFTTTYQKKDPIQGLKMNEPADKKATYNHDDGAPKGTERPYGKVGEGKPFDNQVNECGDVTATGDEVPLEEDGSGLNTKHSTKKNTNHINRSAQNQRHVSTDGNYEALKESARKIYNKALQIQEENKKYKECISEIKKSLKEAAVLNMSLSSIVKLLSENTTTATEKKSIVERFGSVQTIKEGKTLYETIKKELNESKKSSVVLESTVAVAPSKKVINETTIYTTSKNPVMDLMQRMDNLHKN